MKITEKDIEAMLGRVQRSLASMGVVTNNLHVAGGSRTNGVAYRLYQYAGDSHGVSGVIMPDGFLGTTKREAYDTLHAIAQSLEFVNDHVDVEVG
jgi:hypothetical protein